MASFLLPLWKIKFHVCQNSGKTCGLNQGLSPFFTSHYNWGQTLKFLFRNHLGVPLRYASGRYVPCSAIAPASSLHSTTFRSVVVAALRTSQRSRKIKHKSGTDLHFLISIFYNTKSMKLRIVSHKNLTEIVLCIM